MHLLEVGVNRAQHNERLQEVLIRLQEEGLTLNGEKCEFAKDSIMFLGHHITARGISKTESRTEFPTSVGCFGFEGILTQQPPDEMSKPIVSISRGMSDA